MGEEKSWRRSIRLRGHDYVGPGAYFITICTYRRRPILSSIRDPDTILTTVGELVEQEWRRTGEIRDEVRLDEYVIMPNHFHGVVMFLDLASQDNRVGAHGHAPLRRSARSLGSLVARFKGAVTRRARQETGDPGFVVWQRNYYERVIRNQRELNRIRRYIRQNPLRWERDPYFAEG